MKIFINDVNEDWIVDRFKNEWQENHKNTSVKSIKNSDIVWIISPWTFKSYNNRKLKNKIVLCTIHHLDIDNLTSNEYKKFMYLDMYVDYYHVLSKKTKVTLQKLTNKKIFVHPFWVNNDIWYEKKNAKDLRLKYGFSNEEYLIGSFQRDTEGKDLTSPKLIKGPDVFVEIIKKYFDLKKTTVVLTGKRRQYIIKRLQECNINFKYFEMTNYEDLNNLYNILNLYIVSSRLEGGPQQILECATVKTPVISTDVGIADQILSKKSIYTFEKFKNATPDVDYAYKNAQKYFIPNGFRYFEEMFEIILKNED